MPAKAVTDRAGATKGAKRSMKAATGKEAAGFTAEERSAMRERARELQAATRRPSRASAADGEADLLASVSKMAEDDREMATRLHALVTKNAPALSPRTWYGMPAYAKDGNVIFFFKNAGKFKMRYATLGFSDKANLDDGTMWPTEFALKKLDAANEARILRLIEQAVG